MQTALLLAYVWRSMMIPVVHEAAPLPIPSLEMEEQAAGTLTVSVEQGDITGTLPRGASHVPFLTINFSASCGEDIDVVNIDVTHEGLGASSDIASVYAVESFRRISRARGFDMQSKAAKLTFSRFTVPECQSRRITIQGNIALDAAAAGEHAVTLKNASSISSSARQIIFDTHPNTVHVVTAPKSGGVIGVNFLNVNGRLRYGTLVTAARIQFSADNESDHLLKEITLTNQGTARNMDLQRLFLERNSGERVSRVTTRMDGKKVTMTFDPPFLLKRGDNVVLLLKGETFGSSQRTVNFTLEEDGDLFTTPTRTR